MSLNDLVNGIVWGHLEEGMMIKLRKPFTEWKRGGVQGYDGSVETRK